MKLFPWQKQKEFFSEAERAAIVEAVRKAEQRTSGEVRVFIESRCRFVDPIDRAKELFASLKMYETAERNGVLVYLAMQDHQAAIFADEGIYTRAGQQYWNDEMNTMLRYFREQHPAEGLVQVINDIGEALHQHFPYDRTTDKNELPDDIVFGR